MTNERLKAYLKDDLKALEFSTIELIDNLYCADKQEQFKKEIEEIERFFSYWNNHIKNI